MAIKTRESISLQERYEMVKNIIEYSVSDMKLDSVSYEISKIVNLAKYYSNFEMEYTNEHISYVKTYDSLMANSRFYKYIIPNINKYELKLIEDMLEVELYNSTSLSYLFVDKLSKLDLEEAKNQLKNLDLSKLDGVNEIISTFQGK